MAAPGGGGTFGGMTIEQIKNLRAVADDGDRILSRIKALENVAKDLNGKDPKDFCKFLPTVANRPSYNGITWPTLETILLAGMRQFVEAARVEANKELEALKL